MRFQKQVRRQAEAFGLVAAHRNAPEYYEATERRSGTCRRKVLYTWIYFNKLGDISYNRGERFRQDISTVVKHNRGSGNGLTTAGNLKRKLCRKSSGKRF
jgi:hypothetical protein